MNYLDVKKPLMLFLHVTDNLAKSPFEIVFLGILLLAACAKNTFVPISLAESMKNTKDNTI